MPLVSPQLAAAALALLATGCAAPEEREPSWTYLHAAIIAPNCATASCHSSLGATPIGSSVAGLQLDGRESAYLLLTGRACAGGSEVGAPARNFVAPGDPDASKLLYLLRGEEVRRMPPDQPLPQGEIELVEAWILAGAPCD